MRIREPSDQQVKDVLSEILLHKEPSVSRYHLERTFGAKLGAVSFVRVPTLSRGRNRVVPVLTEKGLDILHKVYMEGVTPVAPVQKAPAPASKRRGRKPKKSQAH